MEYSLPPIPSRKEIDGWDKDVVNQKFCKWDYPNDAKFEKLTEEEQLNTVRYFLKKRIDGHWFMNCGEPTYITGDHWFFLNFWRLDTGLPQYRRSNRDKCYFWDLCVKDPYCVGMVNMENRRGGKTELANAMIYNYVSRTSEAHGGIQSKTNQDAKAVFLKLIRAWKRMPEWTKPIDEGDTQPKSALRFFEPGKRSSKQKKKEYGVALDSFIDFEASKEEAYDGQKLKRYVMDEAGKTTEANVYERWNIVKECFFEGINVVGKAMVTTTVEEMEKKGGKNFKELWDKSNQYDRDENGFSKTGLYRYFKPAYDCLAGFIDDYGNPLIEQAKKYLENKRNGQDGTGLSSEKRKYPFCEEDAFGVLNGMIWEEDVLMKMEYSLKECKGVTIRHVAMIDINGKITATPLKDFPENSIKILEEPKANTKYSLGIDCASTDNETGNDDGSKIAAVMTKGFGEGERSFQPIMAYSERALKKETCYHKIYLMAKYAINTGAELEIIGEINGAGADCFHYLCNKGLKKYMTGTPKEYANESAGEKTGKFWVYVNGDVLHFLHGLGNRFIRMYGENFRLQSVLQSLLNYGKQNEDEASAFLVSLLNFRGFDKPVVKKEVKPKKTIEWKLGPDGNFQAQIRMIQPRVVENPQK